MFTALWQQILLIRNYSDKLSPEVTSLQFRGLIAQRQNFYLVAFKDAGSMELVVAKLNRDFLEHGFYQGSEPKLIRRGGNIIWGEKLSSF